MTSKILITGCKGQLGSDLINALSGRYSVKGIDMDDFDLRDKLKTSQSILEYKPDLVIHAAAYTDVDGCEKNVELAMESNAGVTENIARTCKDINTKLIFYSTDYVFDGEKKSPYLETDIPCPMTVYGKSKLEAEKSIAEYNTDYAILRIAWLYGKTGKNFPKTIIGAGINQLNEKKKGIFKKPLIIVNDQIGNPTWTIDVIKQTEQVISRNLTGIYHCTSEGEVSWYQFAKDIFELLGMDVEVKPCTTAEYPRPAKRPRRSSLENKRFKDAGINVMRHYKTALAEFLSRHGGDISGSILA